MELVRRHRFEQVMGAKVDEDVDCEDAKVDGRAMVLGQDSSRGFYIKKDCYRPLGSGWPPCEPLMPARTNRNSQAPNDPFH